MEGWIKLHRKMLNWGWYTDTNTKVVFLHLLLLANYGEREFLGHKIKPGQCVISYGKLAKELGLTVQNVRTALKNLESSQEINRQVTSKFQLVTIEKWAFYQGQTEDVDRQMTGKSQANDREMTGKSQGDDNTIRKKEGEEKNNINKPLLQAERLKAMREQIARVNQEYRRDKGND